MYLLDFCPHDLFPNTRADLGRCQKVHSEIFKERFDQDQSSDKEDLVKRFEWEYMQHLKRVVDQCEGRISRARHRVEAVPPEIQVSEESRRSMEILTQKISQSVRLAEQLAEQGSLAESATEMQRVSEMNLEMRRLAGEKYLKYVRSEVVCQVCGALMLAPEDLETCEDHLRGKQHSGFLRIRRKVEELQAKGLKDEEPFKRSSRDDMRREDDTRRESRRDNRFEHRRDWHDNKRRDNGFRRRSRSRTRRSWSRGRSLSSVSDISGRGR